MGTENGSGGEQRLLVNQPPLESLDTVVIRHLGISLAQTQVDLAYALARNAAAKAMLQQVMTAEPELAPMLGTLFALLG